MLTHISVKNFKKFDEIDFELGGTVVLIGPNNSGKTAALQALALWDIGLKKWHEKRSGKTSPEKRPGVTINRRDLVAIPTPNAILLWKDLHIREGSRNGEGKPITDHVTIDIIVSGFTTDKAWKCGLEFDYANDESIYCRPLRILGEKNQKRMPIPSEALEVRTAILPPMSGLAAIEEKHMPGRINVLIGEGQTAQVLRNLCYQISGEEKEPKKDWIELVDQIEHLFGVELLKPEFISTRGEIIMLYRERSGVKLDLSSSGRGLQQTLLLLAHLYSNPRTVLLLDEPDAHLEILRQQQTYQVITEVAEKRGSQLIIASHSEVVLNEAADRDMVIAFIGKPHRIDDRGSQVLKSLKRIGFDQYYLAEHNGWVLYLEGSTDLAILRAFAETLNHEAKNSLERPFVYYVGNQPTRARDHFFGLKEAKKDLVGIAIFDKGAELQDHPALKEVMWNKCELENYLCKREVLMAYAKSSKENGLFGWAEENKRLKAMQESIEEITKAKETLRNPDPWSDEIKASDDFLDILFPTFFEKLGMTNLMNKSDYHILARLVLRDSIDPEVIEKLNLIVDIAQKASPVEQ